jgi:hypothetical protein
VTNQPQDNESTPTVPLISGPQLSMVSEDYSAGEITVVYDRTDAERDLLFAVIELLPSGLETGPDDPKPRSRSLAGNTKHELNVIRWHVSPADAILWYDDARNGRRVSLPTVDSQQKPLTLKVGKLASEPPWPSLVYESELFWNSAPFWGERPGGSRISQAFCIAEGPDPSPWNQPRAKRAREWLQENLPIDLFSRKSLWGSVNLVFPNPLFRRLSQRLTNDEGRRVALELKPYPGKSVEGLQIIVREHRPRGPAVVSVFRLASPRVILDFPHSVHRTEIEVMCPKRGLLFRSEPATFIRQIQLNFGLIAGQRQVVVPQRSRHRPSETHTATIFSPTETSAVGVLPSQDALDIALQDKTQQQLSNNADLGIRWFNGAVESATQFVQDLVSKARRTVIIVDAYFDAIELRRFALANATRGVAIQILTSKMFLRDGSEKGKTRQREREFQHDLEGIRTQDSTNTIEVRVMGGEKAEIHDRFLLLDDNVWLLGSSLNEFGERGSTAVRLENPLTIPADILRMWNNAQVLADFVASGTEKPTE